MALSDTAGIAKPVKTKCHAFTSLEGLLRFHGVSVLKLEPISDSEVSTRDEGREKEVDSEEQLQIDDTHFNWCVRAVMKETNIDRYSLIIVLEPLSVANVGIRCNVQFLLRWGGTIGTCAENPHGKFQLSTLYIRTGIINATRSTTEQCYQPTC